jgi:hypothetical protein
MLGEGRTKSGIFTGLAGFVEESSGIKVSRANVHAGSPGAARKEFDDEVADDIHNGGHLKNNNSGSGAEQSAEILMPSKENCTEPTTILFTDGALVRVITSCSSDVARRFEKALRASIASAVRAQDAH